MIGADLAGSFLWQPLAGHCLHHCCYGYIAGKLLKIKHFVAVIQLTERALVFPGLFFLYFFNHAALAITMHGYGAFAVGTVTHVLGGVQVIIRHKNGIAECLSEKCDKQQQGRQPFICRGSGQNSCKGITPGNKKVQRLNNSLGFPAWQRLYRPASILCTALGRANTISIIYLPSRKHPVLIRQNRFSVIILLCNICRAGIPEPIKNDYSNE